MNKRCSFNKLRLVEVFVLVALPAVLGATESNARLRRDIAKDLATLHVKKIVKRTFRFPRIHRIEEGKILIEKPSTSSINLRPEPGESVSVGHQVPGTEYVLARATPKRHIDHNGISIDVSDILLSHIQNGKQFALTIGKIADSLEPPLVLFRDAVSGVEFPAKLEGIFHFPPKSGRRFRVVEITNQAVIVEEVQTRETFKIDQSARSP